MMARVNVLTVKEVSNYLRVHPSTVYKLSRNEELPGFRIGVNWNKAQCARKCRENGHPSSASVT